MAYRFLLIALFIAGSSSGYAQHITGAAYFPTASYPTVNNLQIDNSGNYLMSINVGSYVVFGTDTFADSTHCCVASVNAAGALNWVKPMGGYYGGQYFPPFLLFDKQGRTFVLGSTKGLTAVGDTLVNYGTAGIFMARLNNDGSLAWIKNIGSNLRPSGITEDNNNNVIICAQNVGTAYIGPDTLPSDLVLAKFDTAGNLIWAKSSGAVAPFNTDLYQAISADSSGNIYAGGTYENDLLLDTLHFNIPPGWVGGIMGFIAKFDSNGQALWAEHAGDWVYSLAAGPAGNIYASGAANGNLTYDTAHYYAGGWFIAKFAGNGALGWVRGGLDPPGTGYQIALDKSGICYGTGSFADSFSMYPNPVPAGQCLYGYLPAYTLALDTAGNLLWVQAPCNPHDYSAGTAIAVSGCNVAVAGRYGLVPFVTDTFVLPLPAADSIRGHSFIYLLEMDSCHGTQPTAVADLRLTDELEVYPNPSYGRFHILAHTLNYETCRFNVVDINGRQVCTGVINPGDNVINANLPSGIYIVNVFSNNAHLVKKLVVIN